MSTSIIFGECCFPAEGSAACHGGHRIGLVDVLVKITDTCFMGEDDAQPNQMQSRRWQHGDAVW